MTDMIAGAQIVHECSAPPDHPVQWRVVFPGHHCAVSLVAGERIESQTSYGARQLCSRLLRMVGHDRGPEQCEVEMVT